MGVLKRSCGIAASVVVAGTLAACSGGTGSNGQPTESPQQTQAAGPQISNPKDASAVALCDLLPAQAATSLGFEPEGKINDGPKISPDAVDACMWRTPNGHDALQLAVNKDRSIQEYYDNKSTFTDYEELTIAGYPAVRANQGNPAQDGACSIFLAVSNTEMIHSFTTQTDVTDPCAISEKALEASIPTLPAAK